MTATLEELCARALAREATTPALEYRERVIDWGALRQVAQEVASLVATGGASTQALIVLVPRNRPSAMAALLGLICAGYSVRMVYAYQAGAALARELERLKPVVVIAADEDFSDEVRRTLHDQGAVAIALTEMDAAPVPGLARSNTTAPALASAPRQLELLTSGTTGPPKPFPISFDLIARHLVITNPTQVNKDPVQTDGTSQPPPFPLYMPLGNISGIYTTLPTLIRGQRAIVMERFDVGSWHRYVLRYRPTITGLPPAGVQMVLDANIPQADLASIRTLSTGAAALDPTTHRAFEERYGIPILLSYGATEFAGPVTAMTAELHKEWGQRKFASVGRALPGARLRVVDAETGGVLPAGEEGLLEVICARIGPDWIRTSDIVVIDGDGFMFHRGRADGAIMRGGFKLLPETIERALMLHESVAAAGVLGLRDARLGEVPAAAIQLKPGVPRPGIDELQTHLRGHVYSTHIPVTWRFVDQLPRTPSLKVDRRALRELF